MHAVRLHYDNNGDGDDWRDAYGLCVCLCDSVRTVSAKKKKIYAFDCWACIICCFEYISAYEIPNRMGIPWKCYCLHIHLATEHGCSFTQTNRLHIVIRISFWFFVRLRFSVCTSLVVLGLLVWWDTRCVPHRDHSLFPCHSIMCESFGRVFVSLTFSLHAFICKKAAIIWDEGTISCSPTKYKTFMCVYFFKIFSYSVTNHTTTKHIRTELSNSRSIQNRISNYAHSVLHQNCMQISQKQDKKTEQILCLVSIFLHPNSKLYDGKSHRLYWSMQTIKFELQLFDI